MLGPIMLCSFFTIGARYRGTRRQYNTLAYNRTQHCRYNLTMARAVQRGRSAAGAAGGKKKKKPAQPKLGDPPSDQDKDDELEFKGSQDELNVGLEDGEEEEGDRKPAAVEAHNREVRTKKAPVARRRKKTTQQAQKAAKHKKAEEAEHHDHDEFEAEDSFDSANDGADSPIPSDPNDSGSDFNPDEDSGEKEVDDDDDELNESSDGWAPRNNGRRARGNKKKKAARSTRCTTTQTSRRRKIAESPSSDEEEEEGNFNSSSNDDDDDEFASPSRRTSRRSCAKATKAKLASTTEVIELGSDQDEADAESDYPMISSSRKKKRTRGGGGGKGRTQRKTQQHSDEESYHESDSDEDGESENEIISSSDDDVVDEDDEDVIRSGRSRRGGRSKSKPAKGRKSVDDDLDIFTADTSDSDDDSDGDTDKKRFFSPKPPLRTKRVRRRVMDDDDDNNDSDEEEASFGDDSDDDNFGGRKKSAHSTPRTPRCPSKIDEITMEPLPRLHVCCVAPDGEGRFCFALDTLYRIALMDPRRHHTDSNKIAFKQPPHFRSVMEDELVDQIASRFGRLALNIEDINIYKRSIVGQNRTVHLDFHRELSVDASQDFHDRFNEYLSSQMGSGDLYCCPLCYVEAHRRLGTGTDPDDDSDASTNGARASSGQENIELEDFRFDPMTVLGGLDGEGFVIASNFCFRKVSQVKKHIRDDHHCATKNVEGNDLYQRFQIRAADGLLQRWLNKHEKKSFHLTVRSAGAMNSYWYQGHNASFIYLRDRVEAVQRFREEPGNEDDNNLDGGDRQKSAEYFDSFERRGRRIWATLSAPYEKEDPSAINDFIADDDEEEEVDDGPAPFAANIFEDEKSPEQLIIESMKKRRRRQGPAFDMSSDDYDDEESSEDGLEIVGEDSKHYSEEEEEDEWTKKKSLRENLQKRRSDAAAAKRSQLTRDSGSDSDGAKDNPSRHKKKPSGSAADLPVAKTPAASAGVAKSATSSLKKRRILESSDEDE